ncbi:ROK family protein [Aliikangiella coralliicola]|uniref:ROK family protein n=1 Tax=Aliikangiella coralliicola TaxID=2592383 RepID=UPI00143D3C62|nr:ROK family protein [Aliikangiella coralliicola]
MITIDLGGTKLLIRVCIENNVNDEIYDRVYQTGIDFKPEQLIQIIADLETEFNLTDHSIAVAFPGLLQGNRCYVSNVVPQFNGFNLKRLSSKGKLEVVLNDVEAGTYGIIKNKNQVEILIMSGTGIGMGIAINGKVFRGENGFSGELGSCKVLCEGRYLRLAQTASGTALKENSALTLASAGQDLGMAVSWVVNCFNPGRIVFAGGMFNEEAYRRSCFDAIRELSLAQSVEHCLLEVEPEIHSIVVRGLRVALQQKLASSTI